MGQEGGHDVTCIAVISLHLNNKALCKTILDLRRMDRPCKKEPGGNKAAQSTKMVIKILTAGETLMQRKPACLLQACFPPHANYSLLWTPLCALLYLTPQLLRCSIKHSPSAS